MVKTGHPLDRRQGCCHCRSICCGILARLAVWASLLLMSIVTLFTAIGVLLSSCCCCRRPHWCPASISRKALRELENRMLTEAGLTNTRIKTVTFLPSGLDVQVIVTKPQTPHPTLPPFLLVHGLASDGILSFIKCLSWAEKHGVEMLLVDMPGFGNSPGEELLAEMSNTQIEDFLIDCLVQVIGASFSVKPALVGHSFGGFVATLFAHRRPDLIDAVTLVAPAGILPTHGSQGALWAIFFRWIITCELLQCCSSIWWWLASHIFVLSSSNDAVLAANLAWFQILASRHRYPVQLHFTELHLYAGCWKRPALVEYLSLAVPVAFIYGELDPIMPPHQGEFFANIAGSAVPCFIIPGATHGPHNTHPDLFVRALVQAVQLAKTPGEPARCVAETLRPGIDQLDWAQWATPFDCWSAEHLILEEMYRVCTQLYMAPDSVTEEDYFQGVVILLNQEEPIVVIGSNPLVMDKQDMILAEQVDEQLSIEKVDRSMDKQLI